MTFDIRKKTNAVTGFKTGLTMIEELYEKSLIRELKEMDKLPFPEFVTACRELMGLKQYACSEYLGMKHPRYKKLEYGQFVSPLAEWEIMRLQWFFKLPFGMLLMKQKEFLDGNPDAKTARRQPIRRDNKRQIICKDVWDRHEGMAGERKGRGKY